MDLGLCKDTQECPAFRVSCPPLRPCQVASRFLDDHTAQTEHGLGFIQVLLRDVPRRSGHSCRDASSCLPQQPAMLTLACHAPQHMCCLPCSLLTAGNATETWAWCQWPCSS